VVNPGSGAPQPSTFPSFSPYAFDDPAQMPLGSRQFRIMGEEDTGDRWMQMR
jgi:hypothetical protein